jgi:hypothetical protein
MKVPPRLLASALAAALAACAGRSGPAPAAPAARATSAPPPAAAPSRDALNRAALELALPLFWAKDADGDGAVDPEELAVIWGLDPRPREHWVVDGTFTPAFVEAWGRVRARAGSAAGPGGAREAALRRELDASYFTVIDTDLRNAPAEDRAFVRHVLEAARIVERIYARQLGTAGMELRIPPEDTLSRFVFFLNQGPWCTAPATEKDASCSALVPAVARRSGLYPEDLQAREGFCAELAKDPRADELTAPFTAVVRDGSGALAAVPYARAYGDDMRAVSRELDAAAAAITSPGEAALKSYLLAAARAFESGDWLAADEAWSRMNAVNSRWYLRVAPDEVYYEPCSLKAGFHVTLARIDQASLAWQKRLEPVKAEMERALAAMAGPPYAAREVSFHLPDFIRIVLNAGDDRKVRVITGGQSLPNWGPVANEGRGRTVAMTNLFEDPKSREVLRRRAESILCAAAMSRWSDDADTHVIGTVLHEAAHNLGPSHEYAVNGRTDDRIFGGALASTLEELKAQTSALYLTDWLTGRGVLTQEVAERAHVWNVLWIFRYMSQPLYDPQGKIQPYPALAAVQFGALLDAGALRWDADEIAANGADRGCVSVDFARLPAAVARLEARVLGVKARGDLDGANALKRDYVDATGPLADVRRAIAARIQRFPNATFLYSVRL